MKKIQAEYFENSITYWPTYEVRIIALIVLGTLFIATSIWVLLDNPSKTIVYHNYQQVEH